MSAKNADDIEITTHYIVIGVRATVQEINEINEQIFADQHSEIGWFPVEQLMEMHTVHKYTKKHFIQLQQ